MINFLKVLLSTWACFIIFITAIMFLSDTYCRDNPIIFLIFLALSVTGAAWLVHRTQEKEMDK